MNRQFAIITLSVVPVRAQPSDAAEQISQLLFGESVEILTQEAKWWKVQCLFDDYIGWIDPKQCHLIPATSLNTPQQISIDRLSMISNGNGLQPISIGSTLPNFQNNTIAINEHKFTFAGQTNAENHFSYTNISDLAKLFLAAPYQWGGRSILGIDCSGFTQLVYKIIGIKIPRDAKEQALQGQVIDFVAELQAGDLVFFDNEKGNIIHVGIALAGGKIIHASGQVRIDQLDHQGIFNQEKNAYTHQLRLMKRFSVKD
jgi:cell wall-associated NlpC family hydrolase